MQPPSDGHGEGVACRRCGSTFAHGEELASIAQALASRSLATDHLEVCPDCRAPEMGLSAADLKLPETVQRQTQG